MHRGSDGHDLLWERGAVPPKARDRRRAAVRAERAGNLLLDFEHAQILLGLIIVEGDRQVVQEGQHLLVPQAQPLEQIARGRLLDSSPLPRRALGRGIARPPGGPRTPITSKSPPSTCLWQLWVSARARL